MDHRNLEGPITWIALQAIFRAPYILVPEISVRNLDKIASVYPVSAAIPDRFYTA